MKRLSHVLFEPVKDDAGILTIRLVPGIVAPFASPGAGHRGGLLHRTTGFGQGVGDRAMEICSGLQGNDNRPLLSREKGAQLQGLHSCVRGA